jgi:hypothetical protein
VGLTFPGIIREDVREESLMAEAAPVAKSKTPTAGFVTVPTIPLVKPVNNPYNKQKIPSLEFVYFHTFSEETKIHFYLNEPLSHH